MITSVANPRVKQVVQWKTKAKERKKDNIFLAEGIKMYEEAPEESVREVYVIEETLKKIQQDIFLWKKLQRTGYETVSTEVFQKMSDTQTPQGILTVLKRPEYQLKKLLKVKNPLFVILEDLQDPGNLGTILRTADALNIKVVLMEGCADPYSHKVVRASMGAVFRTPVLQADWETVRYACAEKGIPVAVTALSERAKDLREAELAKMAVVIGSEGQGVRPEILDAADEQLIIPMNPHCESLNAAIASAIVMWQMKQR